MSEKMSEEIAKISEAGESLIEAISLAKKSIKIYGGEGNYLLYNHPWVIFAFQQKFIPIQVILSPVVFAEAIIKDGKIYKRNGLIELAAEGKIELYKRPTRGYGDHYRIIDGGGEGSRCEKYHSILTPFSKRRWNLEEVDFFQKNKEFDELIKKKEVILSKGPFKDFLFLTFAEIRKVYDKVGEGFNDLTKEEIQHYLL